MPVEPWYRILIRGIFAVILGVGAFWAGMSLASRMPDGKKWIGGVIAILGVAMFVYSFRYFAMFLYPAFGLSE